MAEPRSSLVRSIAIISAFAALTIVGSTCVMRCALFVRIGTTSLSEAPGFAAAFIGVGDIVLFGPSPTSFVPAAILRAFVATCIFSGVEVIAAGIVLFVCFAATNDLRCCGRFDRAARCSLKVRAAT